MADRGETGRKLGPRLVSLLTQGITAARRRTSGHEARHAAAATRPLGRAVAAAAGRAAAAGAAQGAQAGSDPHRAAQAHARGAVAAARLTAPLAARATAAATQGLIDRAGREVAEHYGPMARRMLDAHPDMDPQVREILEVAASGADQWKALASFVGAGAVQGALGTVISNELTPAVQQLVRINPNLKIAFAQGAAAVAAGIEPEDDGVSLAAEQGYDRAQFDTLVQLAEQVPPPDELNEMYNRGLLSEPEVDAWLHRNAIPARLWPAVRALHRQHLSIADAALAVLRGNITHDQGAEIARVNGFTPADFQTFVNNTGEPLGLEELLEAKRRGFIDTQRLVHGILQSRVRDEWVDVAEKLAFSPMSTADAVDAAVQNHIDDSRAAQIASQNGLEPGAYEILRETAGEPLSRTEMSQLYNRGIVSRAQVEQALRESRVKDKYLGLAFDLHVRIPDYFAIVSLLKYGSATKEQAIGWLMDAGYSRQVAEAIVKDGTAQKLAVHKELSIGQIRQSFTEQVLTEGKTLEMLRALGYDEQEAGWLVKTWQALAAAADQRQAVDAVRSHYTARKISKTQAQAALDVLGVPGAARERYLRLWDIEVQTNVRRLTPAQVVKAFKEALFDDQDPAANLAAAERYLAALGYDQADTDLLLAGA